MIDPSFSIDMYNAQLLDHELRNQEPKHLVMDYQNQSVDAAAENVYYLEGPNNTDYFREKDAVDYLEWLKKQYSDEIDMINDFGFTTQDLFLAIQSGDFSTNGTMDLLLFLGAEKVEVEE